MSTITIIRHGQASFGAEDYDNLSDLGKKQSIVLGQYFKDRDNFDSVYVGPCKRHRQTYEGIKEGAGNDFPEPIFMDNFNEYPAFELLKYWTPILKEKRPDFQELFNVPSNEGKIQYKQIFNFIVHAWAKGELEADQIESFDSFESRVVDGIEKIISREGRQKNIAIVTSGGPVSISMKLALSLDPINTLNLGWVVANSSFSEYRYTDKKISLVKFNAWPHIQSKELLTFR